MVGGRRLEESGLLEKMPPNLEKLSWLARLSREQLKEFLGSLNCKRYNAGFVAEAVKYRLNLPEETRPARTLTVDHLLRDLGRFVDRALEAIDNSAEALRDGEKRQGLLREVETKFEEVLKPLRSGEFAGAEQQAIRPAADGGQPEAEGGNSPPAEFRPTVVVGPVRIEDDFDEYEEDEDEVDEALETELVEA